MRMMQVLLVGARVAWMPGSGILNSETGHQGTDWLDAGCGAGTYSRFMTEKGAIVIGVDYSVPSLVKAQQRSSATMNWSAGDVTSLPFRSAYFDGVICFGVTQTLDESYRVSAEILRIIKPGGEIWIDALNTNCLPHMFDRILKSFTKKPIQMRYEKPKKFIKIIKKAGGRNIHVHWLPILPQRLQRFQWIVETRPVVWLLQYVPFLGTLFSHAFVISANREKGA